MTLNADRRATTREIAVLTFAKCAFASVTVAGGQTHPQENVLTNSAGNPIPVAQDFFLVSMLWIEWRQIKIVQSLLLWLVQCKIYLDSLEFSMHLTLTIRKII